MKKNNLLYLQKVDNFKKYIELGVYKYNDKLPSVRSVAVEMGINPNTIQRAYQILETEGYITTIEKKGVFVAFKKEYQGKKLAKPLITHTLNLLMFDLEFNAWLSNLNSFRYS